jgi:pyrroloquinoline-quinone synthase
MKLRLQKILEKWNLLKHPFYQAWSAGKLPVEALAHYAREYGTFIRTLESGWVALGDTETAQEEREHAELWDRFAAALAAAPTVTMLPGTTALAATALGLFRTSETAAGAMYAFEAQQPATAQSKLHGLREHYALPAAAHAYFEVHSRNEHEAERLLVGLERLAPDMQERAAAACETMAESLWAALTAVHEKYCPN